MNIFERLTDLPGASKGICLSEFDKRYQHTYLYVHNVPNKTKVLAQYRGLNINSQLLFSNETCQFTLDYYAEDVDITIPNPEKGYYSDGSILVYFSRMPFRQWKRGLTKSNSYLMKFNVKLKPNGLNNVLDAYYYLLSFDLVQTLPEALQKADAYGEAIIDRDFCVSGHIVKEEGYLLWYHNCIVGEILAETKEVIVQNDVFLQEVLDNPRLNSFRVLVKNEC